jgi:RNA polymerase sigma factor (sigma-70 family)
MEFFLPTQPLFSDYDRENQIQDEIRAIVKTCLLRIRSWPVPRNWSFRDWFDEAEEIATVAAWRALSEYSQPAPCAFPYFAHQRILSNVRTRYRQEFLFAFRFGERFEEHGIDFDEQANDRQQPYMEEPVEPLTYSDLSEALSKLSSEHHEVIEQLYWRGRTQTELAKSIGLSQRAISKRKQGALRALRIFLLCPQKN